MQGMKPLILAGLLFAANNTASAAVVTWNLVNVTFDDGGSAYGSFVYDTATKTVHQIDVYTTEGAHLPGRHYVALAGVWGRSANSGILAFTDRMDPVDYTGASWLRMDFFDIVRTTQTGVSLKMQKEVGAESFCTNKNCSSAANELSNPGKSRKIISGHIESVQSLP
ncbi:hypothetical protein A9404_01655 [Halothiobacillus diazotrophicus]|uniref:CHRD domain-containing protein n=1 Tax=Halothiobacillus diazotrophicus TaxID=1860122 RepID=A0A191ZEF8_9GAMM|nr:hypothetical protein [Halothiobacillus diazotrophicus]ANJ66252.1 hypothetical protein A9404_01655 [Halothiobacillus diazotrophicus]